MEKIQSFIKKREHDYNHQSFHASKYHDAVCYNNVNKPHITKEKNKIIEIEKYYYENTHKNLSIKLEDVSIYDNACEYTAYYYEYIRPEIQQMMQKLAIKDVNMMALVDDLNKHGIHVNALLMEMHKNDNVEHMTHYLQKNNIEMTNILSILYKNNVTMSNLLQNQYIYNLVKKSSYASLFLTMAPAQISTKDVHIKIPSKKLVKKVHVYIIFKNDCIVNINYNNI